jgi:dTDP-D-glucose 4,6-dehydratase
MGYGPRISFADGLKTTVAWYTANRDWWEAGASARSAGSTP